MYSWDGSLKVTDIIQKTASLSAAEGDVVMSTYSSTSNGNLIQQHATTGDMMIKGTFSALASIVSALPAASSVPAGAQAFATNGRKAGEGSGAGTGVPVWSDGTVWRTYYDNTEVQS